jgi:hypothetical protein
MFKHTVVIKLAKILDFGNTSLIEPVIILLETERHRLDHVINNLDHKGRMVAIERAEQDTKKVNASILHLSRL